MSIESIIDELDRPLKSLDESLGEINELTIQITEIPAPPFNEGKRAEFVKSYFDDLDYKVVIDDEGNVVAQLEQVDKPIIISAHLDTVFENEKISVKKDGDIFRAPGVGDDSRGMANLLILAKLLRDTRFVKQIIFVATVGEEGKGDLRGVKYFFSSEKAQQARGFVTIDGSSSERIVNQAIGSLRYRIYFDGPGGHSYGSFGTVNPAYALGRFMHSFSQLKTNPELLSTHSIGIVGGGNAINAIPEQVWVDIDLRSESNDELLLMKEQVEKFAADAVEEENKQRKEEITFTIEEVGHRPAGKLKKSSKLYSILDDIHTHLGIQLNYAASSTDANVPLDLGISAISVAGSEKAGRAHTQDEWIDASEDSLVPIKRNLILSALLVDRL